MNASVNGSPCSESSFRSHVGFNLLESYRAVCNRVEQAAESEVRLKGEIDAVIASFGEVADSADRTTLRGKKTASSHTPEIKGK